jgi:hypothetical protein
MTASWRMVVLAAGVAAAGLGCKGINALKTKAPDPAPNEGEWASVRDLATRRGVVFDRFQERAIVTMTYLSPGVREARSRRLGEWLGWTDKELQDRLKAEAAEAAKYEDFVVAVFTTDRKANDLDSKNSVWRLAVRLDDGNELVTRDATALDANVTVRNLYPYVSPFDTVYRIRLNRAPGGPLEKRTFIFEMASAMGRMELVFGDGAVGPDKPMGSYAP